MLAGARLLDIKQTLSIGSSPATSRRSRFPGALGSGEVRGSNWDAIVGVKGRLALGADGTWFMPYYVDVGTGESDLTWQIMGGIGYSYKWGDIVATWRYLDWNNKPDKSLQGLNLNGPLIAVTFRW